MDRSVPFGRGEHSPWGDIQSAESARLADGGRLVQFVSTASHGGFYANESARRLMPYDLAHGATFAGEGWYEEDCDWCILALGLPDLFSDYEIRSAVRQVNDNSKYFAGTYQWLRTPAAAYVVGVKIRWDAQYAEHFEYAGGATEGNEWKMLYRRVRDSHPITVYHRDYGRVPAVATQKEILSIPGASIG